MFGRINKELKKKVKEYEDQLLAEHKEKETLLSSKADFSLLEKLIKKLQPTRIPSFAINSGKRFI